jgi:hypothetical protein
LRVIFIFHSTKRERAMPALQGSEAVDKRNIAELSEEFHMSLDEVSGLYEAQRMRLMLGAKVGKYFPIFAVRNIRERLVLQNLGLGQTPEPDAFKDGN